MGDDKEQRTIEIILKAQDANASLKEMAAGAAVMTAQLSRMGQDDPGRAKLLNDLQLLNGRLQDGRTAMRQRAQSAEELAAADEAAAAATAALALANEQTVASGQSATASLNQMRAAAKLLEGQLADMSADDPARAQLQQDFAALTQRISDTSAAMKVQAKSAEELAAEEAAAAAAVEAQARANEQTVAAGKLATASLNDMKAAAGLMEKQLLAMSADDPGRAALQRDFTQLNNRIGEATATMRTHLKTAAELAAEQAELAAAAEKVHRQNMQVVVDGQKVNATFNEMTAAATQLEKQLGDLSHDAPGRQKMLADYKALQQRIGEVREEMTQTAPKASLFKQALGFAGITLGVEAVVGGVIEMGKEIFSTTAKFETFETVLTTALGDKSKAKQALKDIQQMAASTPFSVEELTGSFIKFVNRGLNPSMAEMTKLADLAASQGKSFDQLTEAVLDAAGGEFERLKEFGLKASKSGDQVSLSFKGVNQTVKNTPEAIQGAILAFGGMQGIVGSTAAISKTLEGQWSNMGDTADMLKTKLGEGLKPMFSLIITLFSNFIGWISRFVDAAAPLKAVFAELFGIVADLYHDIADVLESLGLFSDKTDTVKVAVEALKVVLTLALLPIKALYQAAKGVVDVFIDWYNKSELLRGVLGGLGYAVVSLFLTIKDNALKILGGVGDIIVGIFSLDKDRIVAGFKSAMSATADVMLEGGNRAAEAFKKGFEANKNNHITRTVRVKTETEAEGAAPTGDKLKSDDSADDAAAAKKAAAAAKKAKAERDRADRERLADLKRWVKDEGDLLDTRDQLALARQAAANTVELQHREAQRQKILDDADKKYQDLATTEGNHTLEMQAVLEERDQKLRELQAGFDEKDKQEKERKLNEQLATMEADEALEAERLDNKRSNGLLSEGEYQEQLYQLQQQALAKRLQLLETAGESESDKAKKLRGALLKGETEHVTSVKKLEQDYLKFKQAGTREGMQLLADGLNYLVDNLDKQSAAYQFFKAAMKTLQLAEIGLNLEGELSANALNAAKDVRNGLPGGSVIVGTELAIKNGLSIGRAALSAVKVAAFAEGGRTDRRAPEPLLLDQLGAIFTKQTGGSFALGGPVGQATLGLIGEAGPELVIPNWLYSDPKQANLMGFLEATIASKGNAFATGGSTTGSSGVVAGPGAQPADPAVVDLLRQLVQGQRDFREELNAWPDRLEVGLDLPGLSKKLDTVKQVQTGGGIR